MSANPAPVVRYSFRFRYQEEVRSVDVPIDRLDGAPFDMEHLWTFLLQEENEDLLTSLLDDFFWDFEQMRQDWSLYEKDLQRFHESAVIVAKA